MSMLGKFVCGISVSKKSVCKTSIFGMSVCRIRRLLGFGWFRSCELAIMNVADDILSNVYQSLLNGLLPIDLKKAFDLFHHGILLF